MSRTRTRPPARRPWRRLALTALALLPLAACDAGSRSVSPEYYTINIRTSQNPTTGSVTVAGDTDLPDGSEIDALVTKPGQVESSVDRAVLIGSTEEEPLSRPIKKGSFTINLVRVLTNSCGIQPPCGPFPRGRYTLLLDARTPAGPIGNAYTTFDDPHYLSTTHGTAGFTGLEITRDLELKPILLCIDGRGEPRTDGCGVAV